MPLPVVPEGTVGRVLVTVQYDVAPESEDAFLARSDRLRHLRETQHDEQLLSEIDGLLVPGTHRGTAGGGLVDEQPLLHRSRALAEVLVLRPPGTDQEGTWPTTRQRDGRSIRSPGGPL